MNLSGKIHRVGLKKWFIILVVVGAGTAIFYLLTGAGSETTTSLTSFEVVKPQTITGSDTPDSTSNADSSVAPKPIIQEMTDKEPQVLEDNATITPKLAIVQDPAGGEQKEPVAAVTEDDLNSRADLVVSLASSNGWESGDSNMYTHYNDVRIRIKNIGRQTVTDGIEVMFECNDPLVRFDSNYSKHTRVVEFRNVTLRPGESKEITERLYYRNPAPTLSIPDGYVVITLDPFGKIPESNNLNNQGLLRYTHDAAYSRNPVNADLYVSYGDASSWSSGLYLWRLIYKSTIKYTVCNNGNRAAEGYVDKLDMQFIVRQPYFSFDRGSTKASDTEDKKFEHAGGWCRTYNKEVYYPRATGYRPYSVPVYMKVDPKNSIIETNEDNNEFVVNLSNFVF